MLDLVLSASHLDEPARREAFLGSDACQACLSKIDQWRRLYFRISEGHSLVDASVSLAYALARPCSTQEACCVLAGG